MLDNFFLWVSGIDRKILAYCEDYVRTRYCMFGAFVLIPTTLAFISMSYGLSTVDSISNQPFIYITGGIIWSLIIFVIDRYFVTLIYDKNRVNNLALIFRIAISLLLSLVISHPLTLLAFDGSIKEQLNDNLLTKKIELSQNINNGYNLIDNDQKVQNLKNTRDCYASLMTAEQSAHRVSQTCTSPEYKIYSSGTLGPFGSTDNIKELLSKAETELSEKQTQLKGIHVQPYEDELKKIDQIYSYDIIKRQEAFDEIKSTLPYAEWAQIVLMMTFIILDLIPVTLKVMTRKTLYEKIILDTDKILTELDIESRKSFLQFWYNQYHDTDRDSISIDDKLIVTRRKVISISEIEKIENDYGINSYTMLYGIILGSLICIFLSLPTIINIVNISGDTYNIAFIKNIADKVKELNTSKVVISTLLSAVITSVLSTVISDTVKSIIQWIQKKFGKSFEDDTKSSSLIIATLIKAIVIFILAFICVSMLLVLNSALV